eukprot:287323-Rhodomonas_salina.1
MAWLMSSRCPGPAFAARADADEAGAIPSTGASAGGASAGTPVENAARHVSEKEEEEEDTCQKKKKKKRKKKRGCVDRDLNRKRHPNRGLRRRCQHRAAQSRRGGRWG